MLVQSGGEQRLAAFDRIREGFARDRDEPASIFGVRETLRGELLRGAHGEVGPHELRVGFERAPRSDVRVAQCLRGFFAFFEEAFALYEPRIAMSLQGLLSNDETGAIALARLHRYAGIESGSVDREFLRRREA